MQPTASSIQRVAKREKEDSIGKKTTISAYEFCVVSCEGNVQLSRGTHLALVDAEDDGTPDGVGEKEVERTGFGCEGDWGQKTPRPAQRSLLTERSSNRYEDGRSNDSTCRPRQLPKAQKRCRRHSVPMLYIWT